MPWWTHSEVTRYKAQQVAICHAVTYEEKFHALLTYEDWVWLRAMNKAFRGEVRAYD